MAKGTRRKDTQSVTEDASPPETAAEAEVAIPPATAEGNESGPERGAGRRLKLVRPSTDPVDSYADGALAVHLRDTILKLDLYRVVGTDKESGEELITLSHRLVFPIAAVAELVNLLQGTVQRLQQDGRIRMERVGEPAEPETRPDEGGARGGDA